jgi:hypothetical protein
MEKSDSIKTIAVALATFQHEQKPIKPNAENKFLKNKYADLTTLIENTKDNLFKNGLAVTQLLGDGVTTILMHSSGEWIASKFEIQPTESGGTNAAQQMGIAITYARRYAYAAILGLVTDEDTDGAGSKPAETKKTSGDAITEAQGKRLYAIYKKAGLTDDDAKKIVIKYGYEHIKDILKKDYEEIVLELEQEGSKKPAGQNPIPTSDF